MNQNADTWKNKFSNKNFESGWGEDRKILWWITFFGLIAILGFLLSAIALWVGSRYYVDSSKMGVGLACFCGIILACFAIIYAIKARKFHDNFVY